MVDDKNKVEMVTFDARQRQEGLRPCMKKPMTVFAKVVDVPFQVATLEGTMTGQAGDYLMRGVEGELYPCAKAIFEKSYDFEDTDQGKTLHNSDESGTKKNVADLYIFGNSDVFQLLCKASSKEENWMKSTKAMEIPGKGCVVQATTQQGDKVAEALVFVPNAAVITDRDESDKVTGRRLI